VTGKGKKRARTSALKGKKRKEQYRYLWKEGRSTRCSMVEERMQTTNDKRKKEKEKSAFQGCAEKKEGENRLETPERKSNRALRSAKGEKSRVS